ncbi:MAG: hypothetical protein JWN52_4195, partial [Actinomycetia bacterium]|nr:hypothetical protein [Actinomycetes bacterium]
WGLIRGNESGWASAEVVAALSGGAIALVVFVSWELRADAPLIPMRFFATRAFSAGNTAGFLLFACTFSGAFFFAQFLQVVLRHGPIATGLLLAPWTVALFVVAPVAGKQVNRIGARPLVVAGLLLQAVGFGWIALIAGFGLTYPPLILPFVISGVGIAMAIPAAQSAVIGAVPMAAIGAASGTFNTVRQLGGAFGIAITTAFSQPGADSAPRRHSATASGLPSQQRQHWPSPERSSDFSCPGGRREPLATQWPRPPPSRYPPGRR